jgi:hypothetical protein
VRKRWLPVVLLALGIFAVNGVVRFISWKAKIVSESEQLTVGLVSVGVVAALLIVAASWWAVRYPFSRLFGDIGAAVLAGGLLSVTVGPFLGGSKPFVEGLGFFVGQLLMFVGLAAVGVVLGFLAMVAVGKDWKSRGLRRYEQNYTRKPHRTVRG